MHILFFLLFDFEDMRFFFFAKNSNRMKWRFRWIFGDRRPRTLLEPLGLFAHQTPRTFQNQQGLLVHIELAPKTQLLID